MNKRKHFPQWPIHLGTLLPFLWLVMIVIFTGGGPNPAQYLEQRSGDYALVLLLLSLACTPLRSLTGWQRLSLFRKPIGLYGAAYAFAHLFIFIGLDYTFHWSWIFQQVFEKVYLVLGFIAIILLIPLVITSTQGWQRRLRNGWKTLHLLVFPTAALVIFHFALSQKGDIFHLRGVIFWPALAFAAFFVMILLRLKPVTKFIIKFRQHLS